MFVNKSIKHSIAHLLDCSGFIFFVVTALTMFCPSLTSAATCIMSRCSGDGSVLWSTCGGLTGCVFVSEEYGGETSGCDDGNENYDYMDELYECTSTFNVTPGSGGNGTIAPATVQTVNAGSTTAFTLTPNNGYRISSVTGTCGGSLSGNVYTTSIVNANCTVLANFALNTYNVTPSATAGGTITPNTVQTINAGSTTTFTIAANANYHVTSVSGCGGSLVGDTYTTGAINSNCSVTATFASNLCTPAGAITWTDPAIVAGVTPIKKIHIDELRTQINNRRTNAGLGACTWTDSSVVQGVTPYKKAHFDEMRTCLNAVYTACGQAVPTWSDGTITQQVTPIKRIHLIELRDFTQSSP